MFLYFFCLSDLLTAFACLITAQKNKLSTISLDVSRMSDLKVFSRCVLPKLQSMELRFDMFQTDEDMSLDQVRFLFYSTDNCVDFDTEAETLAYSSSPSL